MSIRQAVEDLLAEADVAGDYDRAGRLILPLIGSPQALLELTMEVAEQRGRPPSAYLHSNGFLKVEYMRAGATGLRLRGHFWNVAWGQSNQNPHNHAFDFRSHVVCGTFCHRRFSRTEDGEPYFGYRYCRAMRDGVSQYNLHQAPSSRLRVETEDVLTAGSQYAMARSQLHALDPIAGDIGATVMISRPDNDQPWSDVFSLNNGLHLSPRNSVLLESSSIVNYVASVLR